MTTPNPITPPALAMRFRGVPLIPPLDCTDPQSWIAEQIYQMGAALAQPEPKPPTDEELYELWNSEGIESDFQDCRRFARAYATRWGTPANTTNQED